jgi:FAD/FMN-containing dehydrogenase
VGGLTLGGGFGSFSKGFGTAAANLLEADVVTADGTARIVNAFQDPDLFWALKGGGGGTFGVEPGSSTPGHPATPDKLLSELVTQTAPDLLTLHGVGGIRSGSAGCSCSA